MFRPLACALAVSAALASADVYSAPMDCQKEDKAKYDFFGGDLFLEVGKLAKWHLYEGHVGPDKVTCAANSYANQLVDRLASQAKNAALSWAVDALQSMLPFPLPFSLGSLIGNKGPSTAELIQQAIEQLKQEMANISNLETNYAWYTSYNYAVGAQADIWNNHKIANDGALAYTSYSSQLEAAIAGVNRLISEWEQDSFQLPGSSVTKSVDRKFFLHRYVKLIDLYLGYEQEYGSYYWLSHRSVTSNTVATSLVNSASNAQELRVWAGNHAVNPSVSTYNRAMPRIKALVQEITSDAQSEVKTTRVTYPTCDRGYAGPSCWKTKISWSLSPNSYTMTCDTDMSNYSCTSTPVVTVNGTVVSRPFYNRYVGATRSAIEADIKRYGTQSALTARFGELMLVLLGWEMNYHGAKRHAESTGQVLGATFSPSIFDNVLRQPSTSVNSHPTYKVTGLNTVYAQPHAISGAFAPKNPTAISESSTTNLGIGVTGLDKYITHVEVKVNIKTKTPSELDLKLRTPSGRVVELRNRQSNCSHLQGSNCETSANIDQLFYVDLKDEPNINGTYSLQLSDKVANGSAAQGEGLIGWSLIFK